MTTRAQHDLEQTLDQHGAFVRRLAGTLVFDESRADDVVQETWLAAGTHRPRDRGSIRAWLGRIVRNFAFRVRRDDTRRVRREERAARPEAAPPRGSSPVEAALLREVIDAVLALDEPYRSTVLMRFYENLEPSEIAARLGIPAATVRTRLKRALDHVRERFDVRHDGNRRAWTAPLMPLAAAAWKPAAAAAAAAGAIAVAQPAFSGVTVGGILMAKKIAIAGALVAAAVVSIVIATRPDVDDPRNPGAPLRVVEIAETPAAPAPVPIKPVDAAPIQAKPYVPGEDEAAEIVLAPQGAPSATLGGRVIDQAGTPLANVAVSIKTGEGELVSGPGLGEVKERTLQGRTDGSGRFSFAQLPIHVDFVVRARPDALCDVVRPVSVSKPGVLDVGDLVALPGGSVAGVVTGPQGQPLKGCRVSAWGASSDSSVRFVKIRRSFDLGARSATTNASGQYRIDGLPEGTCAVSVDHDEHPGDSRTGVAVKTNEVTWEVDFRLVAGTSVAGIVRDAEGRPLGGAIVRAFPSELKIGGPPNLAHNTRSTTTGPDGRFVLLGLGQDPVSVRARKPGFLSSVQHDVAPGGDLAFALKTSGLAYGTVRDAATNEPVPEFSVSVSEGHFWDSASKTRVVRGADAAKAAGVPEAPGLFAVLDLPETPVRFQVRASGFADARVGPVTAAAGSKVEVKAPLVRQAVIRGVVVDPSGNPVDAAKVSLARPGPSGSLAMPMGTFRTRVAAKRVGHGAPEDEEPIVNRSIVTKDDGSFEFRGLPAGTFRLSASHSKLAPGDPTDVELAAGEVREGVKVPVALGGTFAGRALDADGNALPGARVHIRPRGVPADPFGHGGGDPGIADSTGFFEISGLGPGEYVAELEDVFDDADVKIAMSFDGAEPDSGTPVTIEAGKTTRKDLQLKARASVAGLVKDGGKPASGVKVTLVEDGMPSLFGGNSTTTDANGSFAFEKVAPGDWAVVVDPPGAATAIRKRVSLAPRSEERITIDLPTGVIEGRVTDRAGKPIAGISVTAAKDEGGEVSRVEGKTIMITAMPDEDAGAAHKISVFGGPEPVRTDEDGRYRLRNAEAGRYRLTIKGEGIMPQSREGVAVEEGRTTKEIDFAADKGATLLVSIDPAGLPVNDVFGFIDVPNEPESNQVGTGTVKNGMKFTGLKAGRYKVRVDAPLAGARGEGEVDVVAGQEARVTVRMVPEDE